jgi:uncharacterized GH25 family protein
MIMARTSGLILAILLIASGAWAQDWRGEGTIAGKVVDEQGKPIAGATVRASFPGVVGALEAKTDKRARGQPTWTRTGGPRP